MLFENKRTPAGPSRVGSSQSSDVNESQPQRRTRAPPERLALLAQPRARTAQQAPSAPALPLGRQLAQGSAPRGTRVPLGARLPPHPRVPLVSTARREVELVALALAARTAPALPFGLQRAQGSVLPALVALRGARQPPPSHSPLARTSPPFSYTPLPPPTTLSACNPTSLLRCHTSPPKI